MHSVKGGAAAFGFEDLVGFAHGFETVMDRVRCGTLALSPEVCETLLRAGDMMTALVEAARSRTPGPLAERAAPVMAQLCVGVGRRWRRRPEAAAAEGGARPELAPERRRRRSRR